MAGNRRPRTHTDNVPATLVPGAPKIGTGNWHGHPATIVKAEDQCDEETLDTVLEGGSFSDRQGLGIDYSGPGPDVKPEQSMEDELMDGPSEDQFGDTSNETFELDLDAALEESKLSKNGMQLDILPATIPKYEDEYAPAERRGKAFKSPMSSLTYTADQIEFDVDLPKSRQHAKVQDPTDWLANALKTPEQREAECMLLEAQRQFKDDVDFMDTSMVAEYSEEIFGYMEELEVRPLR